MNLIPSDELNILEQKFTRQKEENSLKPEQAIDEVLDILILAYLYGTVAANSMLDTDIAVDENDMFTTINKDIAGKTYADRVREYAEKGDVYGIARVTETDTHRVYNHAVQTVAEKSNRNVRKLWRTEMDDKVRDTHSYLEGMSVGLNERFFTYDGDSALYPGNFALAENNANCRCVIELTTE